MPPTSSWIVRRRRPDQPPIRLFCFPYAGGGASHYYSWPDALPPEIEVCAIQMPGREARVAEKPFTELDALLSTLSGHLAPYLDVPFAFFGHSMGALIAFELARQLRRTHGVNPVHLIVSGRRPPRLASIEAAVHAFSEADLMGYLRELNGIPEEIIRDSEFMSVMLPVFRADFALCDTYRYLPDYPLSCGLTVLGGREDPHVPPDELDAWQLETSGGCQVSLFPGDHFFIRVSAPQVLEVVSRSLQASWQSRSALFHVNG